MVLSKRMETVVGFVPPQSQCVADIGCDHAYVSISLVERQLAKKVIAMDVRKGPLEIATRNVENAGLHNNIDIRLSDGLEQLEKGEADTIIIAGMGGLLITGILERGCSVLKGDGLHNAPTLILQPQSEIRKVREYLLTHEYSILKEDVIKDEGKYYTVIRAESRTLPEKDGMSYDCWDCYGIEDYLYGRYNLFHQNEILRQYLLDEKKLLQKISCELNQVKDDLLLQGKEMPVRTRLRSEEVMNELVYNERGLNWY